MRYRPRLLFLLSSFAILASGCTSLLTGSQEKVREGSSTSLVDYLYPDGQVPRVPMETLPTLELPLRVGIAFVPSSDRTDLADADKQTMLNVVAATFQDRPYVSSIEAIPDQYLQSTRGIVGMQQVAALYGVDVMALVSYDQLAFSGERNAALLYWTIVGAAVIKGNSNEVRTLVDTAVFDVNTATLLFRAPGAHSRQQNATLFDSARDLRHLRRDSFITANDDMITNLDLELASFEERVKAGEVVQVVWTDGGGGSTGPVLLLALLASLLLRSRLAGVVGHEVLDAGARNVGPAIDEQFDVLPGR